MSRVRPRWCLALAAAVAVLAGAVARADAPPDNPCGPAPANAPFGANTDRVGVISLHFFNAGGAPVTYFECVGTRALRLGVRSEVHGAITSMFTATFWRCGRLTRHFAATATLADGTFVRGTSSVRTMSCAHRFRLVAPRHLAPGARARVRIVDRWGIGAVRAKLCVTPPAARGACRPVVFGTSVKSATRLFRPVTRGRWRVELRATGARTRATIAVGVSAVTRTRTRPRLLATGDSTMQGIESFLSDDLGDSHTVVSDVRPGVGMSLSNAWAGIAPAQVKRARPSTTVVSIGGAEGFPMRGPDGVTQQCCDEPWVAEYARRVRRTMLVFRRNGRARVFWLTLPAPADAPRVPIFAAANAGILRAAEGLARVRVLRMDRLFTPDGFRAVMPYQGRLVRVREDDGIHLNVTGAKIAARAIERALRSGVQR